MPNQELCLRFVMIEHLEKTNIKKKKSPESSALNKELQRNENRVEFSNVHVWLHL